MNENVFTLFYFATQNKGLECFDSWVRGLTPGTVVGTPLTALDPPVRKFSGILAASAHDR